MRTHWPGLLRTGVVTIAAFGVACSDLARSTSEPEDLAASASAARIVSGSLLLFSPGGVSGRAIAPHNLAAYSDSTIERAIADAGGAAAGARMAGVSAGGLSARSITSATPGVARFSAAAKTPKMSTRPYAVQSTTTPNGKKFDVVFVGDDNDPDAKPPQKIFGFTAGVATIAVEPRYKRSGKSWTLTGARIVTFDATGKQTAQVNANINRGHTTAERSGPSQLLRQVADAVAWFAPRSAYAEDMGAGCRAALAAAARLAQAAASVAAQAAYQAYLCSEGDGAACIAAAEIAEIATDLTIEAGVAAAAAYEACMPHFFRRGGGGRTTEDEGVTYDCVDYYEGWYYPETGEIEITDEWTECYAS